MGHTPIFAQYFKALKIGKVFVFAVQKLYFVGKLQDVDSLGISSYEAISLILHANRVAQGIQTLLPFSDRWNRSRSEDPR